MNDTFPARHRTGSPMDVGLLEQIIAADDGERSEHRRCARRRQTRDPETRRIRLSPAPVTLYAACRRAAPSGVPASAGTSAGLPKPPIDEMRISSRSKARWSARSIPRRHPTPSRLSPSASTRRRRNRRLHHRSDEGLQQHQGRDAAARSPRSLVDNGADGRIRPGAVSGEAMSAATRVAYAFRD